MMADRRLDSYAYSSYRLATFGAKRRPRRSEVQAARLSQMWKRGQLWSALPFLLPNLLHLFSPLLSPPASPALAKKQRIGVRTIGLKTTGHDSSHQNSDRLELEI